MMMTKGIRASYTVEAAGIMAVVFFVIMILLNQGFHVHGETVGCFRVHEEVEWERHKALDMDEETAICFAGRYVNEDFQQFNDYVKASMEDFLNLHNGLYSVNMSNDHSMELHLQPPASHTNTLLTTDFLCYLLPIVFSFGTVNFVFSVKRIDQ